VPEEEPGNGRRPATMRAVPEEEPGNGRTATGSGEPQFLQPSTPVRLASAHRMK
jgi:hypothetical protein